MIAAGVGAYAGAKALKDKIIPTEKELRKKKKEIRNSYKFPLQKTQDNDTLELRKAKDKHNKDAERFNEWVDKVFQNQEFGHQTPDIVEQQKTWNYDNIIKHDLEEINNARTQQTTQVQ